MKENSNNCFQVTSGTLHGEECCGFLSQLQTLCYPCAKRPLISCHCPVCAQSLSHVWLLATPWTRACQAPLTMGFSRQAYWSGLPSPPPGIFLTQGLTPSLLHLLHCRWIFYRWATREVPGLLSQKGYILLSQTYWAFKENSLFPWLPLHLAQFLR